MLKIFEKVLIYERQDFYGGLMHFALSLLWFKIAFNEPKSQPRGHRELSVGM